MSREVRASDRHESAEPAGPPKPPGSTGPLPDAANASASTSGDASRSGDGSSRRRRATRINTNYTLLDEPAALADAMARVRKAGYHAIGVDTEFIPESRYVPQLCLVQIATPDDVLLVDPLKCTDLAPLGQLLADGDDGPEIVVHSGSQDIALLNLATHQRIRNVFDTQVAAAFVTRREQASFADLVKRFLGNDIDKTSTVTRWNRRPLDAAQLAYAADDVHFLLPLYDALLNELDRKQRLEWARDECHRSLVHSSISWADDGEGYRKMARVSQLSRERLAVLRELHIWREERAAEENQRPANILADHKLLRIASASPATVEDLEGIRQLPSGLLKRHAETILERVRKGLDVPDDELPLPVDPPQQRHLSAEDAVHLEALQLLSRIVAQQQNLAPALLARRDRLVEAVTDGIEAALADGGALGGWRAELLGPILRRWATGDLRFGLDVSEGQPRVACFDADGAPPAALLPTASGGRRRRRRRRRGKAGGGGGGGEQGQPESGDRRSAGGSDRRADDADDADDAD
ncbi:MAG: ribonuclease D [Planctomycetota bacterium]